MKEEFNCMPKEQFEFISNIQEDMLESTNMTKDEAWDFGFRCWQCGYAKVEKKNIVSEVEAEYGNGWIPCSERLPEKYGRYLVCNDGVAWIADFFNSTWFGKRCRYSDVIAWMPLPYPYTPTTD